MSFNGKFLLINNIKLPINASVKEAFSVAKGKVKRAGLSSLVTGYSVYRRSVDARHKPDLYFVYSIAVTGVFSNIVSDDLSKYGITLCDATAMPELDIGETPLDNPPVIVGSGPCGLFCALMLAEAGYKPIIIERGGSISDRQMAVERFNTEHILDTDCNIQFGAGGAGTFSDGKLVTRTNDPLTSYVLERFIEFGAPEEIRFIAKPHIGTDVLSLVVDRIIDRIVSLGGIILYNTKYLGANISLGRVKSVRTNQGSIATGALVLAIGHSARDTYESLMSDNFSIEAKSFSVGMRIEHLAEDIDMALYGDAAGSPYLGHAEYNLSHDTKNRGVYTFCMCPGGIVVAAASEENGVVVNGMSYHNRGERNSNSAVVCSVFREDYGGDPRSAIEFQRMIERAAFKTGGESYAAPIITVGDFLSGDLKNSPKRILPSYMSSKNIKLARPEEYLPGFVCNSIKGALGAFDKKISGFAVDDAILTGAETRTSAPVRILRDNTSRLAIGAENIYPSGEGAGYAGGISSAAIDGIKTAMALMKKFRPY